MLQILLLSSVLFAAIAVLYASHRAGHTLFVRISAGFALVSAAILAGLAWELTHPPAPTDPSSITISIDQVRQLEHGYRLGGTISNSGDKPVSQVTANVILSECSTSPCTVLDQQEVTLLIHVPAGGRYPLAHVIDMPAHTVAQPSWRADVQSARVSEAR